MDKFVVYILQSVTYPQKTYVGYTSHLILRMKDHNLSNYDKSAYTQKFRPWRVTHVEFFGTKKDAINKEKHIKGRGARRYLENL